MLRRFHSVNVGFSFVCLLCQQLVAHLFHLSYSCPFPYFSVLSTPLFHPPSLSLSLLLSYPAIVLAISPSFSLSLARTSRGNKRRVRHLFPSVMRLSAGHGCVSSRTLCNYICITYTAGTRTPYILEPSATFAAPPLTPTSAHRPHRHRTLLPSDSRDYIVARARARGNDGPLAGFFHFRCPHKVPPASCVSARFLINNFICRLSFVNLKNGYLFLPSPFVFLR